MCNPKHSEQISRTAVRCTFNKDPHVPGVIRNDRETTATARERRFSVFLEKKSRGKEPHDSKRETLLKKTRRSGVNVLTDLLTQLSNQVYFLVEHSIT